MSYFEGQLNPAWSPQHRQQQSWDQATGPTRSGATSASSQREEVNAFGHQFEEVARAAEVLSKSGRSPFPAHGRRESAPQIAPSQFVRQFETFDRMIPQQQQRHQSMSEVDARSPSSPHSASSYQGYLANQRFGPRPNEAEQMLQAKRRAAAQRERELRNYHQEQQYNRSASGAKSDRAMSPGAMSEEDRRDLIQRQHRALYGESSSLYLGEGGSARPNSQDARVMTAASSGHGSSPLAYDSFGMPPTSSSADPSSGPATAGATPRERASSVSPSGNKFAGFDAAQVASVANSPPSGSPTHGAPGSRPSGGNVAPIGTRPLVAQGKRGTPPAPSPLSYGAQNNDRSQSAASNANGEKSSNLGWNGNNGAWGNKVQSVWS